MKRLLAILILSIMIIAGCESNHVTNNADLPNNLACYNNVVYFRYLKGITVVFEDDSTVLTCEEYQEMVEK